MPSVAANRSNTNEVHLGLLLTLFVFGAGGWVAWRLLVQNNSPPTSQPPPATPVKLEQVDSSTLEDS